MFHQIKEKEEKAVAQTSPAKVKCRGINQIAIAVKDLEKVAANFWKILGIGPWAIYNWGEPLVYDRKYHGKPARVREKVAVVQVGGVQLELVQAVEGPSVYRDWIEEHGEGLHHMNFLVEDVEETERNLAEEGFRCIQSGRFGPPEKQYA